MRFIMRVFLLILLTNIGVLATNFWNNAKIPSSVGTNPTVAQAMTALLWDRLKEHPQKGKNYAFAEYWPGHAIVDICNGGSHARIIIGHFVSYTDVNGKPIDFEHFDGRVFDLTIMEDNYYKKGQRAIGRVRSWTDEAVQDSIKRGNLYNAMGSFQLRQDLDNEAIISLIAERSFDYFEKYPQYNMLTNNCGQYVNFIMKLIHRTSAGTIPECCG